MKRFSHLIVALLALTAINSAQAWNGIGHASIAAIAERNLTPEAKQKCRDYLHHTLPYYASWMDHWRNCKGFEHTSIWHGIWVDTENNPIKGDPHNAAMHIERICKKMRKYHKLKDSIVCDNLKYLIHLVGDMHCPVHIKYTEEPLLRQRSIKMNGKKVGYHSYWDSAIGHFNKDMKCDAIAAKYDTLTPEQIANICTGTPSEWARVQAKEMRKIFVLLPTHCEYNDISDQTKQELAELTTEQMLRGGYRLAMILNNIFSK